MSQLIESGQTPEQLFESAKLSIQKHLLRSPLIPKGPRSNLEDILRNRTLMLSDDKFVQEARRTGVSGIDNYDDDPVASLSGVKAMQIQGVLYGEEDKIIFRESVVADPLNTPEHILGGLLEEVAHAYVPSPSVDSLLSIPENSLRIAPFTSYEEVEKFLNNNHELFQTSDQPVDLEDVEVVSIGFLSLMIERASHLSDPILHPATHAQHGFEEARASAVQAIFGAKIQGSLLRPFGSLREQLAYGMDNLFNSHRTLHQGQEAGLAIVLDLLTKAYNIGDAAQEFLRKVYDLDIDQFIEYLRSESSLSLEGFFKIATIFDESKKGNSEDEESFV